MSEKINTQNENEKVQELASWLTASKAKLRTGEAQGKAATHLVVEGEEGQWAIPLRGSIDMVDVNDQASAEKYPVHISVEGGDDHQEVVVVHVGTDDVARRASINTGQAVFTSKAS